MNYEISNIQLYAISKTLTGKMKSLIKHSALIFYRFHPKYANRAQEGKEIRKGESKEKSMTNANPTMVRNT